MGAPSLILLLPRPPPLLLLLLLLLITGDVINVVLLTITKY